MLIEDNINWSELLEHPIVTAQHCNDGNRIAAVTKTLQQTAQQFAQLLNERATLLASSAQFDTALRDAVAIIAILPVSSLGYLCTGDVYCQKGHYDAAISIYDQGLEAVPKSDPYYQQLQQHRLTVATNNSKRIDFISQLPLDIVITNIIPRIEPDYYYESRCEYLYVSLAWQKRILQQHKGLRFSFMQKDTISNGHTQLIRFAPYIQKLQGTMTDVHLDDLFSRARFSNLKELELHCDPTTPRRPFIIGLELVAQSLTHLTILHCPSIQLRDILETCPSLESLETSDVEVIMPSSSTASYPKMISLALYGISEAALAYDNMVDVLSRFPSLLILEVSPMPGSRLLIVLQDHCPYLQRLFYGPKRLDYTTPDPLTVYPNRRGMVSVHLGDEESSFKQDDLIQFLYQQRKSLQMIDFNGKIRKDHDGLWELSNGKVMQCNDRAGSLSFAHDDPSQQQSEASFKRLVNFDFWMMDETQATPFIQWILLNASNINAIRILDSNCQPDIANAMVSLKHLSRFEIDTHNETGGRYSTGIQQFFEYHIAMGEHSTLEEVIIHMWKYVETSAKAWIPFLSQLRRLKKFHLSADTISKDCLSSLEEIGRGFPALNELTLGVDGSKMAHGLLKTLRLHPKLKCLRIGASSLSDNDLVALCTFRNLEYLHLQCAVPKDLLAILQGHISNVEIESE